MADAPGSARFRHARRRGREHQEAQDALNPKPSTLYPDRCKRLGVAANSVTGQGGLVDGTQGAHAENQDKGRCKQYQVQAARLPSLPWFPSVLRLVCRGTFMVSATGPAGSQNGLRLWVW